jgi:hypothetical protein
MKNSSYQLLVNAAGQLLQQHAFDHLSDEKLSRMNSCLHKLGQQSSNAELLNYCREANLYVETATPQSLHQWYAAMSCFGESVMPLVEEVE